MITATDRAGKAPKVRRPPRHCTAQQIVAPRKIMRMAAVVPAACQNHRLAVCRLSLPRYLSSVDLRAVSRR